VWFSGPGGGASGVNGGVAATLAIQ
jgi:hypothetical protein